jgi:bifunctional UDP-N-acetylglucosamine pyrophosphorylase / glucosamine-1-phosphate N-acetyltransferase
MAAPTVIVLAAGQGTRMRSKLPKVLHHVCGRPMVLWPVLAARESGAGRIVVVGGPDRALAAVLPDGVELVVQPEPNGTGGALQAAQAHIDPAAPVVVLSADVPLVTAADIGELVEAHEAAHAAATIVSMELEDPAEYGRVVRTTDGLVERVAEARTAGDATSEELEIREVNAGIYCFDGAGLLEVLPLLRPDNAQGELYLPDVVPLLRAAGRIVVAHPTTDANLTRGVNDRADLAVVTGHARNRINLAHMRDGVTLLDPATTYIDAAVTIGADTEIGPNVTLRGGTSVGEGCAIHPGSVLIDATLEAGASAGPMAYLRPGAVLRANAKAGTFVEIKNSDIGEGTKVPHLSYIGDADVGAGTNLGAGTVTANYDGKRKHRTTVGDNVRTGVDTTLVAPVEIGDDAYTGAGSVITKDVPARALGIARERQRNVPGYADRAPGAVGQDP